MKSLQSSTAFLFKSNAGFLYEYSNKNPFFPKTILANVKRSPSTLQYSRDHIKKAAGLTIFQIFSVPAL